MKSRVVKCSVFLAGHHTSVSLEDEFWHGLKGIAAGRHLQLNEVIHEIGTKRQSGNYPQHSAVRAGALSQPRSEPYVPGSSIRPARWIVRSERRDDFLGKRYRSNTAPLPFRAQGAS